jgi:hypothetical protein
MIAPSAARAASIALAALGTLLGLAAPAGAETFQVGAGKAFASLSEVAGMLQPGDVVEIRARRPRVAVSGARCP